MPITTTPSGGPQGEFSTNTPIYSTTLSATTTSVVFSNIPTTFTDLVLVVNGSFSAEDYLNLQFNGDTSTSYSDLPFRGNGSAASAGAAASRAFIWTNTQATTNSRFMCRSNIQNYANPSINKTVLSRADSTTAFVSVNVGTWRKTETITSIRVYTLSGNNFNVGSTFTLYGIKAAISAPKASGGDLVYSDSLYWYHVFNTTGAFVPSTSLTCDYLVVAGGGGSGQGTGGGGGGGGYRTSIGGSQTTLTANTSYAVTIGAGGTGGVGGSQTNGVNSSFVIASSTITSAGGGRGGTFAFGAAAGGSGGGGGYYQSGATSGPGAAGNTPSTSPSQGNNGGSGREGDPNYGSGGGGGAGGVGGDANTSQSGNGGIGALSAITGLYYAGGGGGGSDASRANVAGTGGSGGGGNGAISSVVGGRGTANTGGGAGGGAIAVGNNGGSGVVIVRYLG
jgi:hypothetical protein